MADNKSKMFSAMANLKEKRETEYLTMEGKIQKLTDEKSKLEEELKKSTTPQLLSFNDVPENLPEIEKQIYQLKGEISKFGWLIGQRLAYIKENALYKNKYDNFYSYCKDELEIARQTAYNLIFLHKEFTQELAYNYGSKLYLLQKLKLSEQKLKAIEWIKENNPTFRELENYLNVIPEKKEHENELEKKPSNKPIPIHFGKKKITININGAIKLEKQSEFYDKLEELLKEYVETKDI